MKSGPLTGGECGGTCTTPRLTAERGSNPVVPIREPRNRLLTSILADLGTEGNSKRREGGVSSSGKV